MNDGKIVPDNVKQKAVKRQKNKEGQGGKDETEGCVLSP